MRCAVFSVIVAAGGVTGFLLGGGENVATKLVLAGTGLLMGSAIGGAVLKFGGAKAPSPRHGNPIPGLGVTSDDLAANYWRDKAHPPFMKPPDSDGSPREPE